MNYRSKNFPWTWEPKELEQLSLALENWGRRIALAIPVKISLFQDISVSIWKALP
jgi:hypothetical protein